MIIVHLAWVQVGVPRWSSPVWPATAAISFIQAIPNLLSVSVCLPTYSRSGFPLSSEPSFLWKVVFPSSDGGKQNQDHSLYKHVWAQITKNNTVQTPVMSKHLHLANINGSSIKNCYLALLLSSCLYEYIFIQLPLFSDSTREKLCFTDSSLQIIKHKHKPHRKPLLTLSAWDTP